jgi:predicted RNase H-related nuclease YkuK (DUF458 family)
MAKYSNGNFFSEDTFKDYLKPIISSEVADKNNKIFALGGIDNHKLVLIIKKFNQKNNKNDVSYYFKDEDVLADNWSLLSKQAVLHSAGVIKLFFDKVEEEKRTLALLEKNNGEGEDGQNTIQKLVSDKLALLWIGLSVDKKEENNDNSAINYL